MQRVDLHLSETHRLAIRHRDTLDYTVLLENVKRHFGSVESFSSYALTQEGDQLTLVNFAEAASAAQCYQTFKQEIANRDGKDKEKAEVLDVGWAHDGSDRELRQKPYIRRRLFPPLPSTEHSTRATSFGKEARNPVQGDDVAFWVVFWSELPLQSRATLEQHIRTAALEWFTDLREGGRLFAKFLNDTAAEKCREAIEGELGFLGRVLSYADAVEFELAKKQLQNFTHAKE